jgi:hypothetical protein
MRARGVEVRDMLLQAQDHHEEKLRKLMRQFDNLETVPLSRRSQLEKVLRCELDDLRHEGAELKKVNERQNRNLRKYEIREIRASAL